MGEENSEGTLEGGKMVRGVKDEASEVALEHLATTEE
jgi:hypothetical protein